MKKPSLHFKKLNNKQFLFIWLIFHFSIVALFFVNYLITRGNIKIDTNLTNMLPKSFKSSAISEIDDVLINSTCQDVYILCANPDFDIAKQTAANVYENIKNSEFFNYVNLYSDLGDISSVESFIHDYRFNLLDEKSIDLINSPGGAEEFAQNALMQAYSPFTTLSLDNLDSDPFMLSETIANNYLSLVGTAGPAVSLKDGVLAKFYDNCWYVMIRGQLNEKGAALASKHNGISEIYDVCTPLEKGETRFIYQGTPFMSHTSSNSAIKEIGFITTISLMIVIVLLVIVFKNPLPIISSVITIGLSMLTSLVTTLAVFHTMHIITLLFGTSLIGSCIDYSVHYFTHWAGNDKLSDGCDIRNHLLPGLSMAIISTGICYTILLFAPFNLLKQMALFSISGLISSYLTTICLFPYIPLPKGERKIYLEKKYMRPTRDAHHKKVRGRWVVSAIFAFAIISLLICHKNVIIKNDLTAMFSAKGRLAENEKEFSELLNYNLNSWFIVEGNSEQEILEKEDMFCKDLKEINNSGYISSSLFVPSIKQQNQSRKAVLKLLELSEEQYEALGFDSSYSKYLLEDFNNSENNYLTLESVSSFNFMKDYVSIIWRGQIGHKYYSVILPNKVDSTAEVRALADKYDGVYYENNTEDRDSDLDKLTKLVLEFFGIAYVIMFVILKLFYNWKQSLKIISIPCLIILVTAAIYSIIKINLDFFTITGIILVFGLGLDYIIYMMENENSEAHAETKTLEPFATLLSFMTTLVSFGALALSSFQPVHMMGLSIFIGLATAYISTMFYDRSL